MTWTRTLRLSARFSLVLIVCFIATVSATQLEECELSCAIPMIVKHVNPDFVRPATEAELAAIGRVFNGEIITRGVKEQLEAMTAQSATNPALLSFLTTASVAPEYVLCQQECMEVALLPYIEEDEPDPEDVAFLQLATSASSNNALQPLGYQRVPLTTPAMNRARFSQLKNQVDVHLAAGVLGGTPGPGFMYMWHFVDNKGAHAPVNHYKIGQTVGGRAHPHTNSEWSERVWETIDHAKMKASSWTYKIDRVWAFDTDALRVESMVHGLLEADNYPRYYRSKGAKAPKAKKIMRSGTTEVFNLVPKATGVYGTSILKNPITYVDSLVTAALSMQTVPAVATQKYTWKIGTVSGVVKHRKQVKTVADKLIFTFKGDVAKTVCGPAGTIANAVGYVAACDQTIVA